MQVVTITELLWSERHLNTHSPSHKNKISATYLFLSFLAVQKVWRLVLQKINTIRGTRFTRSKRASLQGNAHVRDQQRAGWRHSTRKWWRQSTKEWWWQSVQSTAAYCTTGERLLSRWFACLRFSSLNWEWSAISRYFIAYFIVCL